MRIKDIAQAAGVSTATVSRVLSGKAYVRQEMRTKVLAVVEKMNYTPNRAARSLRSKRSSFIGLIVADIQNPFFASLSRAVEDVTQINDYSVILCNSDENPEKEKMYLEMMQSQNAAGVIIAPTHALSKNFPQKWADAGPIVIIDRQVQGPAMDMVLIDNFQAAKTLTEHMLGHGYRRIAGLFGSGSATGRSRRAGFEETMRNAGVEVEEELVMNLPAKEAAGHQAVTCLLARSTPPEAIITSNGLLAAGAFRAIRDKELPVPEAIAFATFDESPWTAMTRPAITVIEQPTYAIGQTASEMLLKRIEDPSRPTRQVVLTTRLVIRQSCGSHTL